MTSTRTSTYPEPSPPAGSEWQRCMVLTFAVINVDKIYAGSVYPDKYFSRLGYGVGKCAQFEDIRSPCRSNLDCSHPTPLSQNFHPFFGKRNCIWNLADQCVVPFGYSALRNNCV